MNKMRDDQFLRESRRRYEDEMYCRGFIPTIQPGSPYPVFVQPPPPPQLMQPCFNMDAAAQCPANYNTMYRNSMYTNSREVTFSRGDELIREIGRRPPQPPPSYGYGYGYGYR
jgi:hypothetical protein